MNLLIDIGNTQVKIKYDNLFVFPTSDIHSVNDIVKHINKFKILNFADVSNVVISSVVPKLNEIFVNYSEQILKITPILVNKNNSLIAVTEETGADIICAVNAVTKSAIVVMLGTATCIIYVENNIFKGVTIAAGIATQLHVLTHKAALIDEHTIYKPKNILGQTTKESISSGLINGTCAMIEGMVKRINPVADCEIIICGGFAQLVAPNLSFTAKVDNNFIFKGMERILNQYGSS